MGLVFRGLGSSLLAIVVFASSSELLASETLIRPSRVGASDDLIFSGATVNLPTNTMRINVTLGCWAANLRSFPSPVSPAGALKMTLSLGTTPAGVISVPFPAWMVQYPPDSTMLRLDKFAITGDQYIGVGTRAWGSRNTITIFPNSTQVAAAGMTVAGDGEVTGVRNKALSRIQFYQDTSARGECYGFRRRTLAGTLQSHPWQSVRPSAGLLWLSQAWAGGVPVGNSLDPSAVDGAPNDDGFGSPYNCRESTPGFGLSTATLASGSIEEMRVNYSSIVVGDGPVNYNTYYSWSSDFRNLNIIALFPMQLGYCSSYVSPLMVFLDSRRPKFDRLAEFPIQRGMRRTYWPEPGPWGFLVHDHLKQGSIKDGSQMFGTWFGEANGFESLRKFDGNSDGWVDARDPLFSSIYLWMDSSGTGEFRRQDLKPLGEVGIHRIPVSYSSSSIDRVEDRAELRERAPLALFRNGRQHQAEVVDVWFLPPRQKN